MKKGAGEQRHGGGRGENRAAQERQQVTDENARG